MTFRPPVPASLYFCLGFQIYMSHLTSPEAPQTQHLQIHHPPEALLLCLRSYFRNDNRHLVRSLYIILISLPLPRLSHPTATTCQFCPRNTGHPPSPRLQDRPSIPPKTCPSEGRTCQRALDRHKWFYYFCPEERPGRNRDAQQTRSCVPTRSTYASGRSPGP